MTDLDERAWYAVYVMPQSEKKLSKILSRFRIENYLPLVPRKRKWSDRIKTVEFPLFPGYVFVHIQYWKDRLTVLQTLSALRFVEIKGTPARLAFEEMESLRILVAAQADLQAHPEQNFPPGQRVRVRSGNLKGVIGVVAKVKNKDRIFVKLEQCNLFASAELDVVDVERLSPELL
ncbi:MAG: UpxY family transcription antiterminator [Leptospirales bacterium]|nr:UpxY family transcription antiterminator [Leptospirales bacterium]